MTQEELQKLYLDLKKCLELGLVPDEVLQEDFRNARANGTLDTVLDEINEKRQENVDIVDFAKDMFSSVSDIEKIINENNSMFRLNPGSENFKNLLSELNNKFGDAKEYLNIQNRLEYSNESITECEKKIADLRKERSKIKLSRDLSELSKITKITIMDAEIDKLVSRNKELQEAKKSDQQLLEASLNNLKSKKLSSVHSLISEVLGVVSKLDVEYRNLELNPEAKEQLGKAIWDARDKVVVFTKYINKEESKINERISEVGLTKTSATLDEINEMLKEYDEEIKKLANELEPVQSVDRIDDILSGVDETFEQEEKEEVKVEEVAEPVIKNVSDLVIELQKLNPRLEVSKNEYNQPSISVENPENIKLPKGFKYDENLGINNKVDDITPYVSVEVKQLEKEKTSDLNQETTEPEVVANEPVKSEEPVKVNTSSKVKSGKQKVKKNRHAIIAPYVKSALMFGGIGAGIALLGGLPVATAAVTVGGIVTVLQKCYIKACDAGLANLPQFKNTIYQEHPEEVMAPVALGYMVSNKAKELLNGIKEYKYLKQYGPSKEEPVEEMDVQPEQVEEVAPLNTEVPEEVTPLEPQPTLSEIEARRIQNETANDLFNRALSSQVDEELDNLNMGGR